MRLTLRTLLAYLDERLEPSDAADIGQRIEESAVAVQVVHRIRDVSRRLRLGAPRLSGKPAGLDPNLVAEYLDNTLPAERVPEFEKLCLGTGIEADAQLAEVAGCHQILALVLSEPAAVDPACRQRMYQLATVDSAAAPAEPAAVASLPRRVEVPDYLRGPRSRWPWLAVPAVAILLGLLAFSISKALRPRVAVEPLAALAPPAVAEVPPAPAVEAPASETEAPPEASTGEDVAPGGVAEPPAEQPPPADAADTAAAPEATPEPAADATGELDQPPLTPDEPVATATEPPAAAPTPEAPTPSSVVPPAPAKTDDVTNALIDLATPAPPAAAETPPAVAEAVGRLVSDDVELIARWNEDERAWLRVAGKAPLLSGERLLSFPKFRPKFTLSSGVNVELVNPARVELASPDAQGTPGLRVEFGRITAMTAGKPGVAMRLLAGDDEATVSFDSADSALGFEVRPLHKEGTNPAETVDRVAAWVYVSQGHGTWTSGDQSIELTAPFVGEVVAGALEERAEALPSWSYGQERLSTTDLASRDLFARQVAVDRPVDFGLKELAVHRRTEVRSLALQCLGLLGEFDGLVNGLNQTELRSAWNSHIEILRFAMALDPETAKRVEESFQRNRPADAERLYRLLWGFDRQQLEQGEAEALVADLDSESLDVRVLAGWNVARITGKSFYQPEQTAKRRQSSVVRLRRMVEEGDFVPATALPGEPELGSPEAGGESPDQAVDPPTP